MEKIDYKELIMQIFFNKPINEFKSYKKCKVYNKSIDSLKNKLSTDNLKDELEMALCHMLDYYCERAEELVEFTLEFMKGV